MFVCVLSGCVLGIGLKLCTYACTHIHGNALWVLSHLFCAMRRARFMPQWADYMKHLTDVNST